MRWAHVSEAAREGVLSNLVPTLANMEGGSARGEITIQHDVTPQIRREPQKQIPGDPSHPAAGEKIKYKKNSKAEYTG